MGLFDKRRPAYSITAVQVFSSSAGAVAAVLEGKVAHARSGPFEFKAAEGGCRVQSDEFPAVISLGLQCFRSMRQHVDQDMYNIYLDLRATVQRSYPGPIDVRMRLNPTFSVEVVRCSDVAAFDAWRASPLGDAMKRSNTLRWSVGIYER